MASYAGAVQAIRDRLVANWTTTPIAFQNEPFEQPIDPNSGNPAPWVFLEVIGNDSELRGAGTPGDHVWLYRGHVLVHVFVPVDSGASLAQQYAVSIGEIYRAAGFYGDDDNIVRTWAPRIDGGGSGDDEGNWYRVTMTCPFEFYHRG
jgi:hypothetical protein